MTQQVAEPINLLNELRLNGSAGTSGQVPVTQGAGLPPLWQNFPSVSPATLQNTIISFANGDSSQNVTVTNAGVSISNPPTSFYFTRVAVADRDDFELSYIAELISVSSGSFVVKVSAHDVDGSDLTGIPIQNVTLNYIISIAAPTLSGANLSSGLNFAQSSIPFSSTGMDLFALNNIINVTTSAGTLTSITNAPQSGALRRVYFQAGTTITHGATFTVDNNANYTTLAGDALEFEAITTTTFRVRILRASQSSGALIRMLAFESNGTYDKTINNPSYVEVEIVGGGSGATSGLGGSAGGYATKKILGSAMAVNETVTIGAGGAIGGGAGGTTSFGSHFSATGGNWSAGNGGVGVGGDINIAGGDVTSSGTGGASYFGGGRSNNLSGGAPGSGGSSTTSAGRSGLVIVREYA